MHACNRKSSTIYRGIASLSLLFAFTTLILVTGCSSRSLTKPRSEIVEEAMDDGVRVRTIEQDRALYEALMKKNDKRLFALLEQRSRASLRNANYRVGPGDEIEVNVFDVEELNVAVRVRESGYVSLPLVGAVRAGGLTEKQLEERLRERLKSYVIQPQLSVFVSNYGSQQVAVLGAVTTPGNYSIKKGKNTVLEMISQAGGLSEKAGNYINFVPMELAASSEVSSSNSRASLSFAAHSKMRRGHKGLEVNLEQLMGTGGQIPIDIPVRGGDMIIIPEGGRIMVEGEVEARGTYELGTRMTLLGALAAAGGITYGAKVDEIEVVRPMLDDRIHLVVNLQSIMSGQEKDVLLRNGDVIRVPSDSSRRLRQDTFESISSLINFGVGGTMNIAK